MKLEQLHDYDSVLTGLHKGFLRAYSENYFNELRHQ